MSENDLIAEYDSHAAHTQIALGFYLEELSRRRVERQMSVVARLTWALVSLTVVIVVFTIVLAIKGG